MERPGYPTSGCFRLFLVEYDKSSRCRHFSLSASRLTAIVEAARPIPARDRSDFLRDVVDELRDIPSS
jgi:hypothetical protein